MEKLMIHESTSIAATPGAVASAIASPHGLAVWLCNEARSDKRADGLLLVEWWDGKRLVGRWTSYEPPSELAWRWRDDVSGEESTVAFAMVEGGEGTDLTLTVAGVPAADADPAAALWRQRLADLKMYVETGINARDSRRAMLGITFEPLDEELVRRHEIPVTEGVWVSGVVDDGGAKEAGLQRGDVIVALDDTDVAGFPDLSGFLGERQAGDKIDVRFLRAGEAQTAAVTTRPPVRPDFPSDVVGLRDYLGSTYAAMISDLRGLLSSATEAEAEHKPDADDWSIKEVMAHLILGEKFGQDWMSREIADAPPMSWPIGVEPLRMPIVAALPLTVLLDRFETEISETRGFCLAALDGELTPPIRQALGGSAHFSRMHFDEHMAQIKSNLESARSA